MYESIGTAAGPTLLAMQSFPLSEAILMLVFPKKSGVR
jgi:hypothetical protein